MNVRTSIISTVLLSLFVFSTYGEPIYAQVEKTIPASPSAEMQTITYDLAYPGILPDNPFYKLKVFRDKIIILLITDPRKKIDFYLLHADKGILASAMLIDKNKLDLANETALKAEHNMTLLVDHVLFLPEKPEDELFAKLETASLKHQEVLQYLMSRLESNQTGTLSTVLDFSKRNLNALKQYRQKPPERWHNRD